MLAQVLWNSIPTALILAVNASAFALIHRSSGVFHIAFASIWPATGTLFIQLSNSSLLWPLAIPAAILLSLALTVMCDRLVYAPLSMRSDSSLAAITASLGLHVVLLSSVLLVAGSETRMLSTVALSPAFQLSQVRILWSQLHSCFIVTAALLLTALILQMTSASMKLRALGDDPEGVELTGLNVRNTRSVAFLLAGFLTAAGAIAASTDAGMGPHQGMPVTLMAAVATILAGDRTLLLGASLAGFFIGTLQGIVAGYCPARWQEVIVFSTLTLAILIKGEGFLSAVKRLEER